MKRAFSILLCAAAISCGGPSRPAPVVNLADPVMTEHGGAENYQTVNDGGGGRD
jgi:hypothetical protein